MKIEKLVSPFIAQQFPAFYKEEGPNFIAFAKAYYEWLESSGQALRHSRSLLEYSDIDETEAQFLQYFKNTYLNSLPESIIADKRLLVKHILDLYRSKGTPRAYELLFRLLFNESIELYIPGDYLFIPSSGEWVVPRYIEVTSNPYLEQLVGKQIYNSSRTATAVVENINEKIVNSRTINVLFLSSIDGRFKYGEKIFSDDAVDEDGVPLIKPSPSKYKLTCNTTSGNNVITTSSDVSKLKTGMFISGSGIDSSARIVNITESIPNEIELSVDASATGTVTVVATEDYKEPPTIIGSLTAIAIENGGYGFTRGDILDVDGGGRDGKARVAATRDESGKVFFTLIEGGSGFTKTPTITVATTKNLSIEQSLGANLFVVNTSIVDSNTNANATITFANSSFIQMINFSANLNFNVGDTVTGSNGASATILSVIGGGGTGATFQIGDIVEKEIYQINTDLVGDYSGSANSSGEYPGGADLETQIRVYTGVQTVGFTVNNVVQSSANVMTLECIYTTTNVASNGEFFSNGTLGIANLFVLKADGGLITVTGSESDLDSANLAVNALLISNTTSSVIRITDAPIKETAAANGIVYITNTTSVTVNVTSTTAGSPYFVKGATIIDANNNLANATIDYQVRLTDWLFPSRVVSSLLTNLDSILEETLIFNTLEAGKISYLTNINPGSGYSSEPYVDILEEDIAALAEDDGFGGIKGHNAVVNATVSSATGVVTAVEVIDSGFGFVPNETVYLSNERNQNIAVTGAAVIDMDGTNVGSWRDNKGFLSDIIKIQDSYYYQRYSYEIVVSRMVTTYEKLVYDLVHPTGTKLFGRFQIHDYQVQQGSEIMSSVISQS